MMLLCALYVLVAGACVVGVCWQPSPAAPTDAALPTISIIVAIRNEERDLPRCIAALEALDYPPQRCEVLLVDDASTDGSCAIMAAAAARNAHFRTLSTHGFASPLRVKARPVDLGARHATGEWLLITDADGAVHPAWARALMQAAKPTDGIVCGPFVAMPRGLHGRLESLVCAFLMAFCFGLSRLGVAPPCLGPNMAMRRRVYMDGGGLAQAHFFVAEDIAMWRLSHAQGLHTRGVLGAESTVVVTPTPSWRGLLSQHHRWLGGGLHDGPPALKFVVAAVAAIAWLASAYTLWGVFRPTPCWATLASMRAALDFCLVLALRYRCRVQIPWAWFAALELYIIAAFFVLPLLLLRSRTLAWRGEGYVEILQP